MVLVRYALVLLLLGKPSPLAERSFDFRRQPSGPEGWRVTDHGVWQAVTAALIRDLLRSLDPQAEAEACAYPVLARWAREMRDGAQVPWSADG